MKNVELPMKDIAELLEREGWRITGYIRDEETYYSHIYGQRDDIIISITAPHSGNGFSYMLRADYAATHDKWGNAIYEEFFTDAADLILKILMMNFAEILDRSLKI